MLRLGLDVLVGSLTLLTQMIRKLTEMRRFLCSWLGGVMKTRRSCRRMHSLLRWLDFRLAYENMGAISYPVIQYLF